MKPISWIQKSGELVPTDDARRLISLASGQVESFKVVVYPMYKSRTVSQNSLFHALVNQIASQTGEDRDTVKAIVKDFALSRGFPYEVDDGGLPMSENGRLKPISTSEASVEQMEMLIESTYEFAFRNGLNLEEYL